MHDDMLYRTDNNQSIRNYVGIIESMAVKDLIIETELFPREALEFYTRLNLGLPITEEEKLKYKNAARGGGQGDYREGIQKKIANVINCLQRFPQSKRAVLTIPFSTYGSMEANHTNDDEAKCLRELHFYLEKNIESKDSKLSCTGFMRAQAASIFPKNVHYIGSIMNEIGKQLNVSIGTYTHFVTILVNER